jgi:hypothetical protein
MVSPIALGTGRAVLASRMARLDPITREVACRRLDAAEVLARAELEALMREDGSRLAIANATRQLGEILLADDRGPEARAFVYEARRRYRPYRNDRKLAGEVDLLLASYAFEDGRSDEGEEILEEVVRSCEPAPEAQLVMGRARRLQAHLAVMRFDFKAAREPMGQALKATQDKLSAAIETERLLNRSQYLFTYGEIALLAGDTGPSKEFTDEAWRWTEANFQDDPEYLAFARQRATHAREMIDANGVENRDDPGGRGKPEGSKPEGS